MDTITKKLCQKNKVLHVCSSEITYRDALHDALWEEMKNDEHIFLLGEDIGVYEGAYKVTRGFLKEFGPERVIDAPISEALIAGAAAGAAAIGMRPVVEIMYVDFLTFCMDEVVNQAAKMRYMFGGKIKVPMTIRTQGGSGRAWAAQHSQSLETWFLNVPGLKVVMPCTPYDAKGLLKSSIWDDNPVIFIEHKELYNTTGAVPQDDYRIPLGVAEVKRRGGDVTIVSWSRMCLTALEAAKELAAEGIDCEVIDLRTIKPMDIETVIDSVRKTNRVVIAEEGHKTGGVGGEVWTQICEHAFDYLDAPVVRVAAEDVPIPCVKVLEQRVIPYKQQVIEGIRKVLRN